VFDGDLRSLHGAHSTAPPGKSSWQNLTCILEVSLPFTESETAVSRLKLRTISYKWQFIRYWQLSIANDCAAI
jgi:hypothetical protein